MSSKSKQCKITNIEAELSYVRARQIEIIAALDSKKVHKKEERKRKLRQKLKKVKI